MGWKRFVLDGEVCNGAVEVMWVNSCLMSVKAIGRGV